MTRIAGLLHWGKVQGVEAENVVSATMRHMIGTKDFAVSSNTYGAFAFQLGSANIATYKGNLLMLDGKLLDRQQIEDNGPDGDAGLVLRLCLKKGFQETLKIIEGDIAVAFFEEDGRRLWLSRDLFGVKPLYYASGSIGFSFASLPAALAANIDGVDNSPNSRFVALFAGSHYRTFDNYPLESPFAEVNQVPAAHFLQLSEKTNIVIRRYWNIEPRNFGDVSEKVLVEEYRALLFSAVKKRLSISKAPAFTLSGGMDSSSILCCAKTITAKKQAAYSTIYSDPTYDEREEIQDVVLSGLVDWHPLELTDDIDLLNNVSRLVRIHNEPIATATWLSHDLLCREVSRSGYKELFGGLGGDELNAGEYEYFPFFFADLKVSGDLELLHKEMDAWVKNHNHPIHEKSIAIGYEMMRRYTRDEQPGRCTFDVERLKRYFDAIDSQWYDLESFQPVMEHPFDSYLANRAYQDLTRETTPCCLRAEDRQCVSSGMEHYDPFLDKDLVEFMFSIPPQMKIRNGVTKSLLRQAMAGIVPDATRARIVKTGWNAPAHVWFTSERGISALSDMISSSSFRNRGLYDLSEVERLVRDHRDIVNERQSRENHMMFLWQLINVETWLQWVDQGLPG